MIQKIKNLIVRLSRLAFPCRFNEPLCSHTLFGCRCGKGFFSSRRQEPEIKELADPFKQAREPLLKFLNQRLSSDAKKFEGDLTAPLSGEEKRSLDFLKEFGNRNLGANTTFQISKDTLDSTLSGDFDPTTSPFYQAVKAEASRNLEDVQRNIADQAGGAGRFFSGARVAEQADAATDVGIGLNKVLGQLAENERARQTSVLPLALDFLRFEEGQPLAKAQAFQQFGALPRLVEQGGLDAIYREFLRRENQDLQEAGLAAPLAQAPIFGEVGFAPSPFEQISPLLGDLITAAATGGTVPKKPSVNKGTTASAKS